MGYRFRLQDVARIKFTACDGTRTLIAQHVENVPNSLLIPFLNGGAATQTAVGSLFLAHSYFIPGTWKLTSPYPSRAAVCNKLWPLFTLRYPLNASVEWVTPLLHTREFNGSYLGPVTACIDWAFSALNSSKHVKGALPSSELAEEVSRHGGVQGTQVFSGKTGVV